jgi:hypothetical protein
MTEDEKRKFDAWESLRDHAWREFEEKTRVEWRLSFGIWTALLASAGALISADGQTIGGLIEQVALWVIGVVVLTHAAFLYWIQKRLRSARDDLYKAQVQMRELLNAPTEPPPRSIWKQVPMYVEFGITILLVGVLGIVFDWWTG